MIRSRTHDYQELDGHPPQILEYLLKHHLDPAKYRSFHKLGTDEYFFEAPKLTLLVDNPLRNGLITKQE